MKVLLIARDVAPSKAFAKLDTLLRSQGHDVHSFLGDGKPIAAAAIISIDRTAAAADVVLTGLSSSPELAKEELLAAESAVQKGIPLGFYADTFGSFNRPWFAHLRDKVSFLFVLNEKEAEEARPLFPNANVVVSGNPTWDEFWQPKMSKEDARAKLGVANGRKVLFCIAAGKMYQVNMLHLGTMISVVARMGMHANDEWHLVFSTHPGDEDQGGHYKISKDHPQHPETGAPNFVNIENLYAGFQECSNVPITIATKKLISTADALSAATVVVDSGSTSGIEAIARNIPIVEFMTEPQWKRMGQQAGRRRLEPVEQGCAPLTEEIGETANAIRGLLVFGEFERKYLPRQKECYPKPTETGVSLRIMAETLAGILKV